MQLSEVRQSFSRIEQCIDDAARTCQTMGSIPNDLKQCVQELDRRTDEAKEFIAHETDETRIRQCVDDLEQLGDRAMQTCRQAGNVDSMLQGKIQDAHNELSRLKHQLH